MIGFLGSHGAQVEQRESERRMHERSLHVDTEDHAKPYQVDAEVFGSRSEQRNDNESELEEIQEEGENKDKGVDENEESDLAARSEVKQILDPHVTIHAVEGQRENTRPDQDKDHEGR